MRTADPDRRPAGYLATTGRDSARCSPASGHSPKPESSRRCGHCVRYIAHILFSFAKKSTSCDIESLDKLRRNVARGVGGSGTGKMTDQKPTILVVVLNYRTPDLVIAGLHALQDTGVPSDTVRVVVVDGGSGDGSADRIADAIETEDWSTWCELLALEENGGFAFGNNAAIRRALDAESPPDYVLLLNPDTEVRPGAVQALVDYMQANPEVGIAGSRLEDPDGTPQMSAFRFPSIASEILGGLNLGFAERLMPGRTVSMPVPDEATAVDWLAGASMMIRRAVFQSVGLFDEGYFLYYEETDFCLKAHRAGWKTHYVPESRVVHYVGQATGVSDERRPRKRTPRYWFESRERYFMQNHGRVRRHAADLAFAGAYASFRIRQRLQRKKDTSPPQYWRDFVRFNFLPEWEPPRRPLGSSFGGRPPLRERGRHNENPADIGLLALLMEDFETHGRNPWEQGLWAVTMHRLGNARMSIRWVPARAPLTLAYRMSNKAVEVATGITLPYTVRLGRRVRIWHHSGMILHAESIGDDVTIRHNTTFGVARTQANAEIPIIGNNVDLGTGVSILGAVRVGDGSVVGAHSVVVKDIPAGQTVVGIPARPLMVHAEYEDLDDDPVRLDDVRSRRPAG